MTQNRDLHTLAACLAGSLALEDCPPEQWINLQAAAIQHGLAPMLYWKLQRTAPDLAKSPAWEPSQREARAAVAHHLLLEDAQRRLAKVWGEAGIPCLWLKGIALAQTVYPRPDLRPMGDLDVLVPFEQREEALALAQQQGYKFAFYDHAIFPSTADPLQRMISHHYHLVGANNITLELHHQLARSIASEQDSERLWAMAQPTEYGMILKPEAHLLYLCAHAIVQHGEGEAMLQRFYDIHLLATATSLDWTAIINHAATFKWTYAVERALRLAADYFSTPVPEHVWEGLRAARPLDEDVRRVDDLRSAASRWIRAYRALKLMDHPTRVRYFRSVAIPTRAYMRHRYHVQPNVPIWPYYLYRWFDQGRVFAAWIWRRIRGR